MFSASALLIIAALVPKLAVLSGIGIIVLVVGVILAVLDATRRAVGGRRERLLTPDRGRQGQDRSGFNGVR